MIIKVRTCALQGIGSYSVEVEADVAKGRAGFGIIGLGDSAVKEASERVQIAITQSGLSVPKRTLINLAPAEFKKEGSSFDLPIAMAVLFASGQITIHTPEQIAFFGELSLGGLIKEVRGIVALVLQARLAGCREVLVPAGNFQEAALIPDIVTVPVRSLQEAVHYIRTGEVLSTMSVVRSATVRTTVSLADVVGQQQAKRAFEIAATGGHHVLMVGPPGCGKSMLAERFSTLLPALSEAEITEVVQVHSIAGLPVAALLNGVRPYRAPHHGVSEAGLIGGGSVPRPGEISLAHRGVLFLDELPEYKRGALESLRAPLENRKVVIARAKGSMEFPAYFQLLAAMNACPCGRAGVPNVHCLCGQHEIARYLKKLSQPLLDRFDIQIELDAVPLGQVVAGESHSDLTDRVQKIQEIRAQHTAERICLNAELSAATVSQWGKTTAEGHSFLQKIAKRGLLSARGYFRILRVSRTIADLAGSVLISSEHIAEAVQLRCLDRMQAQLSQ